MFVLSFDMFLSQKKFITKQINCHFSRENCYQTCYASQDFPQNINFSSLKFLYHRLANKKELILSQKKYFKTLKGIAIVTIRT